MKVKVALTVCEKVRKIFGDFRAQVNSAGGKPWEFETDLVLARFNQYEQRLVMLNNIFQAADDFAKLEKVEISSEKLSLQVKRLFELQAEQYVLWGKKTGDEGGYDCMNPTIAQFKVDYDAYLATAKDIDRRLGTIASQAFDDAAGLEGSFKLIFGLQGLLERPDINQEVIGKYPKMISQLDAELETVKQIFDKYKDSPRLGKNMPHTAGALKFAKELRDRIGAAIKDFPSIKKAAFETEEAKEVFQKCNEMMELLGNFEGKVYEVKTNDDIF